MARQSTHALGKPARPYSQISDGQKVKVKGQANIPTKRQKTDMASLVASVVGGAFGKPIVMLAKSLSKPMLEKALQPLIRSRTQPSRKAVKEQLKKVQETVNNINRGQLELGVMETRKHMLLHNVAAIQEQLTVMQDEFQEQYGTFDINIQDGTINYKEDEPSDS